MPIAPIPIPPYDELYQLFVVENKTIFGLHKHYGVANGTAEKWILKTGLKEIKERYFTEQKLIAEQQQNETVGDEYKLIDEGGTALGEPERSEGSNQAGNFLQPTSGAVPAPLFDPDDEEDATAFGRLSRYKQKFVLVYVDNQNKKQQEIANLADISVDTLQNNLKDPDVREAILDLARANFKFKGELSLLNRIQQLEDEQKDRPDDRKLKADILGLTNGNTVNINFNSFGGSQDKSIKRRN